MEYISRVTNSIVKEKLQRFCGLMIIGLKWCGKTSKRLKELNILLNMDEKDYSIFELLPSEEEIDTKSKDYMYER